MRLYKYLILQLLAPTFGAFDETLFTDTVSRMRKLPAGWKKLKVEKSYYFNVISKKARSVNNLPLLFVLN